MLTRLIVKNFKKLQEIDVALGEAVILIGPNNSGKTTALQALALWNAGLKKWSEKRGTGTISGKKSGIVINRQDLIAIPIPDANLLWHDLHVRNIDHSIPGKPKTKNIRIDIIVEGIKDGAPWKCGLEFDYANQESFYCRPLRLSELGESERMLVPQGVENVTIAYLPPMSGLAADETKLEQGKINVLMGQGQTAQVLRNLCYQIYDKSGGGETWKKLTECIHSLFKATLLPPKFVVERGEIVMSYKDTGGIELDLSSSGRGFQQTLLLLAHLFANPGVVLLLDEPDAHLEVIRQRGIYQLLTRIAREQKSQIIAASHSEVVMNEAADRDVVISFLGKPHRIDDRGSQILKSLKEIPFDQYYQAEQAGWVLYLEGSTDLAILKEFATILNHPAGEILEKAFVHYVANQINKAREHYYGLKAAKADLIGIVILDRIDETKDEVLDSGDLSCYQWKKREIENYYCSPEILIEYAGKGQQDDLFSHAETSRRTEIMDRIIRDLIPPIDLRDRTQSYWDSIKITDELLDPIFERYFTELAQPNLMRKTNYHELARFVKRENIDPEIIRKLDYIKTVSERAVPVG